MRTKHLWLLSAVLIVGFVVLASPAPLAAIDTCKTNCNCEVSCSTSCIAGHNSGPPDHEFIIDAENCGEYDLCDASASCAGNPSGCPAQTCTTTINGTSGGDTLNGGSAHECIYGNAGNDTLDGGAGDDTIYGGTGTDTLTGNSGNDCLYGEADADSLDGNSGYDLCDGGTGAGTDTCTCEVTTNCP